MGRIGQACGKPATDEEGGHLKRPAGEPGAVRPLLAVVSLLRSVLSLSLGEAFSLGQLVDKA